MGKIKDLILLFFLLMLLGFAIYVIADNIYSRYCYTTENYIVQSIDGKVNNIVAKPDHYGFGWTFKATEADSTVWPVIFKSVHVDTLEIAFGDYAVNYLAVKRTKKETSGILKVNNKSQLQLPDKELSEKIDWISQTVVRRR